MGYSQRQQAICNFEVYLDLDSDEEIVDHAKQNGTDIVLTTSKFILLDDALNVLNTYSTPNNGTHTCNLVSGHPLQNMFLMACQSEGRSPYFVAYKKTSNSTYSVFGEYQAVPSIQEVFNKFAIVGNTLIIPQKNKLVLLTTVIQAATWYIRTTSYVLDAQFFNTSSLNVTDFSLSSYEQDQQTYYRILTLDYENGVFWADAISRSNNLIPFNNGFINVKSSFYIPYTSRFRQVTPLNVSQNSTQFIVQTYVDGNYQLDYTTTNSYLYLVTTLNRYKDWNPFGSVRTQNHIVAIPYQNYQKTVVINLFNIGYRLNEQQTNLKQEPADLLISASVESLILYFTSANQLVYRSDFDTFTQCTLSNYNVE
ncbi:unnamed protein product (macronuclear) [Paramecium tetraurelia]|uniref:Uncharacterized protein n=1 Tax=Paramecium tetraurelia TaxID=5888 RepID=A0CX85_PARTE|nr:uncharacterized protein GSPATT00001606001 [Paramecium tetraurelia]CAK75402.1 unnamed protein product [Paramecium tetraurelia]|eukprot:XP_001442799.1 hypothetical protein (macronuclear) [Paramecium tetraurelia strain d4-2]